MGKALTSELKAAEAAFDRSEQNYQVALDEVSKAQETVRHLADNLADLPAQLAAGKIDDKKYTARRRELSQSIEDSEALLVARKEAVEALTESRETASADLAVAKLEERFSHYAALVREHNKHLTAARKLREPLWDVSKEIEKLTGLSGGQSKSRKETFFTFLRHSIDAFITAPKTADPLKAKEMRLEPTKHRDLSLTLEKAIALKDTLHLVDRARDEATIRMSRQSVPLAAE